VVSLFADTFGRLFAFVKVVGGDLFDLNFLHARLCVCEKKCCYGRMLNS
jgi:hypothetical protein